MFTYEIAVFFTAKKIQRILDEGGTSSWRLDRNHARKCLFAVCTRNEYADWVEGPEPHHSAFLVGKVKDVVPARGRDGRFLVQFSEYALVNVPNVWKGDRNPVRYTNSTLEDLGIDTSTLKWQPMPAVDKVPKPPKPQGGQPAVGALSMAEAKQGLAITFGVAPESIEITVRG